MPQRSDAPLAKLGRGVVMAQESRPTSPAEAYSSNEAQGFIGEDRDSESTKSSLEALDWEELQTGEEVDDAVEPSKSSLYLFILTLSGAGLQMAWATELANGSPYLQSLGMSKSFLSFVWIAGPLSGVLVQPYIGIRSDNCRMRWGKRVPFMVGGSLATTFSYLCLAWAREIVVGILGGVGFDPESQAVRISVIMFAVVWVYILDVSINLVQAAIRAFFVDNAPYHQQESVNAWASRLVGIGNISAFLAGFTDLPQVLPWLGHNQMQVLCSLTSLVLCGSVFISVVAIRERDPWLDGPPKPNPGLLSFFTQSFQSARRMSPQIRQVCFSQFFSWMGWFGFLFYMSTYVGQIKLNPLFRNHPDLPPEEVEAAWVEAARYADFALLIFAIVSFTVSILGPFFITPRFKEELAKSLAASVMSTQSGRSRGGLSTISHISAAASQISSRLPSLQVPGLTLRRAWLLSQVMFAICMFSTFVISTPLAATILTAFIGVPSALTHWAPFALISSEISQRDSKARLRVARMAQLRNGSVLRQSRSEEDEPADQAGVTLGLHNVSVSAPQIVATLISSIIFKFAQKPRGSADDDSVGWVLRFGGLAALAAAYCIYKIDDDGSSSLNGVGALGTNKAAAAYVPVRASEISEEV